MEGEVSQVIVSPVDFGVVHMFLQAHIVVKLVIVGLVAASVWCWSIVLEKYWSLGRASRTLSRFDRTFWSGKSLEELFLEFDKRKQSGAAAVFMAAMQEWKLSRSANTKGNSDGVKERIRSAMDLQVQEELAPLQRRLLFLGTIGASAPFVGLFGTVWGIMNSFQAIAISKNTDLSVVAPGIAEALFATALGLVAAIPAVVYYNKFSSDIRRLGARLDAFSEKFAAVVSRNLDQEL